MTAPPPSDLPPQRRTAVAIVGTDLVLAAFPATPVQIAHALQQLGYDVVVPASWGDELLAAAALENLEERGGVPAVFCACPRVAERLLATGPELAPVLLPLVVPPVAAARYVRAVWSGGPVTVTYFGGCCATADASIDARITPREFLRMLQERDLLLGEMPRVFEGVIPPDRRRHLSLPGGLPEPAQLARLSVPRQLACLTSADYAAELAQLVIAREPVLIDVAARLGCACVGATSSTPYERAHETVTRLEPPRASYPVVDASLVGALEATLPESPPRPAPVAEPADLRAPQGGVRTTTPPRGMPPYGASPRSVQHTPPSQSRYPAGEPHSGPSSRKRGAVTGFFRGVGSAEQPPRARTGEGTALPRAYVAKRRHGSERNSGEREAAAADERELPIARHVEPVTPTPPAMPAYLAPPAVSPLVSVTPVTSTTGTAPQRATAAVPRTVATPQPEEVRSAATHGRPSEPRSDAMQQENPGSNPPTPHPSPASPVTPEVTQAAEIASTPAARPDAERSVAPATPATPSWRPIPASSGRELLYFVLGALLAGLAFALFR